MKNTENVDSKRMSLWESNNIKKLRTEMKINVPIEVRKEQKFKDLYKWKKNNKKLTVNQTGQAEGI